MDMDAGRITIAASSHALGRTAVLVAALCAMVAMLDGFDAQAIAYAGPRIAEAFGARPSALGPVFAASLVGAMAGGLGLSPTADRFGRKTIILISTAIFGIFSLATASSENVRGLMIFRFLTGVGLGAALPNLVALTSEYAPPRWRATVISVMSCGFPLGAVIGGLIASPTMSAHGWPTIFIIGGFAPLILLLPLAFLLPESTAFVAARDVVRRRGRDLPGSSSGVRAKTASTFKPAPRQTAMPVIELFRGGRAAATLLIWAIYGLSLLVAYFLVNWLPILLHQVGLPLELAIYSTAMLNVGGIIGALVIAWWIDRWNAYAVLGLAYALAAAFILSIGFLDKAPALLLLSAGLAGSGIFGAQIACNALASSLYPVTIRSTGLGWSLGVARVGAIAGPLIGGMLLAEHWRPQFIIMAAAGPALLAALAVIVLGAERAWSTATPVDQA
jgi:AAHS family 4-hydroxybenzoate transporter-like MFS transporter